MPLPKRSIEPVYVSRSAYQQDELQVIELETITNTALTNIIRQLSSLSKHAEDIFGELARDVGNISNRANSLQARIDHLSIKVTQLDSTMEDVPLTDITRKKGFRSTKTFDQKIFSHSTMPAPMLETYSMCDKPPPLNKLNNYRDDGKDGLKFYTDPNYFFELWRQEMLKDTERVMHDKGKKLNRPRQDGGNSCVSNSGSKKRIRKPHSTTEKLRLLAIGQGETLMPHINYQTPNSIMAMETGYGNLGVLESRRNHNRPNSIDILNVRNPEQATGNFCSPLTQVRTSAILADNIGIHSATLGKNENGILAIHSVSNTEQPQMQDLYDDEIFNENQTCYEQYGSQTSDGMYTPGVISRMKIRPSQPPPAPPSNGSRSGTPVSSNANTPTRSRHVSSNRDILPPPPPIPDGFMNTTSPPRTIAVINGNTPMGNNFANINMVNISQQAKYHDLPSSAQPEHQHSKKLSAAAAPPPPPPPPPLSQKELVHQGLELKSINGDIHKRTIIDASTQHLIAQKRLLPPLYDSRTDLMKAIRDGITLRKVEKSEQKEIERNTGLHDVASILARRVAIELSESEESDTDDDSEGWMESVENSG